MSLSSLTIKFEFIQVGHEKTFFFVGRLELCIKYIVFVSLQFFVKLVYSINFIQLKIQYS